MNLALVQPAQHHEVRQRGFAAEFPRFYMVDFRPGKRIINNIWLATTTSITDGQVAAPAGSRQAKAAPGDLGGMTHTYERHESMQTLIVGRDITGVSAFA